MRLFDYKKPSFWQNIQIIRNELQYFTTRYYDLIANNSNPTSDSVSNINRIHNLILRYENEIEDINAEFCFGMKDIDEDVFQIYIEFWYEKAKILSNYV